MTRDQLLVRIETAWQAFQSSYAGLSEESLQKPGVAGDWSVKDIIAHVAWWEDEALKHLPHILAGGRPPRYSVAYGGVDAFNAMMREQRQDRSFADILLAADRSHRQLMDYVRRGPEHQIARET